MELSKQIMVGLRDARAETMTTIHHFQLGKEMMAEH
jgi:hypothetical protein